MTQHSILSSSSASLVALLFFVFAETANAQDLAKVEIGIDADINFANGSPANDIIGGSITGTYRWNDDWLIGARIGTATFDYERPSSDLNLNSVLVVDATVDSTEFGVFLERRYNERTRGGYWYWTAGLGINDLDISSAIGQTTEGLDYQITTSADTEFLFSFTAGRRHKLADRWSLGYGIRAEQRSGDWTVTDRISGQSKVAIDGYFVYGLFLETRFSF